MRLIFLIAFVAIFISKNIYAQNSFFEEGYYIQRQDTIAGYIERTNETDLSKLIKFKSDINSTSFKQYRPTEIKGFGFRKDSMHFESIDAEIRRDTIVYSTNRFAKLVLRGYTSLYKLQIPNNERLDIFESNNTYVYILKKENKDYTLGQYEYSRQNTVGLNKRYIGILKVLVKDCLQDFNRLDNLEFNDKSIIDVIETYNACKNPTAKTRRYSHQVKPIIKHGAEVAFGRFLSPDQSILSNGEGYSIGYFWDVLKPDISRRFSSRLGINYLYLKYTNWINLQDKETVLHFIRVPLLGQANFINSPNQAFIPFINFGLTGVISSDKNLDYVDLLPFFCLGGGFYIKNTKFGISVENEGLRIRAPKIVNFTIGLRLDKKNVFKIK